MTQREPLIRRSGTRYRWFGLETGPCCAPCNALMVLYAIREGRDEWRCPRCGALR